MKVFKGLKEAFSWAFSEKEDFNKIKNHFNLSDEVERIGDVFIEVDQCKIESYLLDNSYVEKKNNSYVYNQ